jgi:hypothetical protein
VNPLPSNSTNSATPIGTRAGLEDDLTASLRQLLGVPSSSSSGAAPSDPDEEARLRFLDVQRYVQHDLPGADVEPATLRRALDVVRAAMGPADAEVLSRELVRLTVLTAPRSQTEVDIALRTAALCEELERFPTDHLVRCLREWPRKNRFFPTLAELLEDLERRMKFRRLVGGTIARKLDRIGTAAEGVR